MSVRGRRLWLNAQVTYAGSTPQTLSTEGIFGINTGVHAVLSSLIEFTCRPTLIHTKSTAMICLEMSDEGKGLL